MFLRASTQWNLTSMGGFVGLNYQSLEALFRIYGVKNPRKLFAKIQYIEAGALKVINEREKKEKNA